ncbi:MAG: nucleoside kinase [Muribaculaceae bacterium]|nr:nucleoside kinase [Muribaculaceae bacterium]
MASTIKIYCINTSEYVEVEGGASLLEVSRRLAPQLGFEPICARVNNKNEAMAYQLFQPKTVEFLPVTSPSGERAYIRSLCMVLYRAVTRVAPQARLSIEHSISRGYYCRLGSAVECTPGLVSAIAAEMRDIVGRDLPFERNEALTADVIRLFEEQGLDDKVSLLRTTHQIYTTYYRLDGICDSYYGTLAPRTGMLRVWELRPFKEGFLLVGFDHVNPDVPPQHLTQEKMYRAFTDYVDFNAIAGVRNVGELNDTVERRRAADLVNVTEALHEKALARISDEITRRYHEGGARVVLIAGPSSSGKTTTTKRLGIQLMTNLLKPQLISLDNYFINRELTPRDETGDYDYESLYALDLEQFNRDLNAILAGEEVELPTYNFELGRRQYKGQRLRLDEGSILLIEGIHGLNPALTAQVEERMKFRVYVSALTTITIDNHNWIPTTDNRLLRRIIRDHKYRGTSAIETIRRWPSVRRGEEKWIFPYQENADATFNSSLLYELAVMRDFAEPILKKVPHDVVEYSEAYRLLKFLSYFEPIELRMIPSTSLLREFLGGSSFKY